MKVYEISIDNWNVLWYNCLENVGDVSKIDMIDWEGKMEQCVELYRVWVAFGVGLFIGGVVGVVAMSILNMARD